MRKVRGEYPLHKKRTGRPTWMVKRRFQKRRYKAMARISMSQVRFEKSRHNRITIDWFFINLQRELDRSL